MFTLTFSYVNVQRVRSSDLKKKFSNAVRKKKNTFYLLCEKIKMLVTYFSVSFKRPRKYCS